MSIFVDLIGAVQELIQSDDTFFPELFTDPKYLVKHNGVHPRTVALIKNAAGNLPGVFAPEHEKKLSPSWKPDIRLYDSPQQQQCLGIVEYESLNSSDHRVIYKDAYKYEDWVEKLEKPVPLLIITTLPDREDPEYKLKWNYYSKKGRYSEHNIDHNDNLSQIRRNPFRYWYAHYHRWLKHRIAELHLPLYFANFSGNKLSPVSLESIQPEPYQPDFKDGSDKTRKVKTRPEIEQLRIDYKKKLWAETDLAKLMKLLTDYWSQEQKLSGARRWDYIKEDHFRRWLVRMRTREEACRWIEKVQWAMLYA